MTRGRTTTSGRQRREERWSTRIARTSAEGAPLTVWGANVVLELLRSEHPLTSVHLDPAARHAGLAAAAEARGVPVALVDRQVLDRLAGSPHHQGAVAVAPPFRYRSLEDVLASGPASLLLLDGIQDPRNLGAILRTARAAGVGGVVLPADRSAAVTPAVVVTAAGLLFGLAIARVTNLVRAMGQAKDAGLWLVGLVPDARESLYRFSAPARPALVVGGEGEGLRPLVRRTCDFAVSVPMAPGVESLNAAVATGIALYELTVRRAGV